MRFVKPIDVECIQALAADHELIVTIEDNVVIGGAGSEVARVLETLNARPRLLRLGLPDTFIDHGGSCRKQDLTRPASSHRLRN